MTIRGRPRVTLSTFCADHRMNGKGSKRRKEDWKKIDENWKRIRWSRSRPKREAPPAAPGQLDSDMHNEVRKTLGRPEELGP